MRPSLALLSMLLLGLALGLLGTHCDSSPSSLQSSGTVIAWMVERPRFGESLRVEDIEIADPGDCVEARYRVVLTR